MWIGTYAGRPRVSKLPRDKKKEADGKTYRRTQQPRSFETNLTNHEECCKRCMPLCRIQRNNGTQSRDTIRETPHS